MGNSELSSNVQKILCFIRRFVVSPPNKGVCSRCNIVLFTTKPNLGTDRGRNMAAFTRKAAMKNMIGKRSMNISIRSLSQMPQCTLSDAYCSLYSKKATCQ